MHDWLTWQQRPELELEPVGLARVLAQEPQEPMRLWGVSQRCQSGNTRPQLERCLLLPRPR